MTDEISNEELRLRIAKAKGWHDFYQYCFLDSSEPYGSPPDTPGKKYVLIWKVPNYPEDIAAAWKLVEEMPNIKIERGDNVKKYYVSCHTPWVLTQVFYADTAPRAIALAWLAWKEAQK